MHTYNAQYAACLHVCKTNWKCSSKSYIEIFKDKFL